MHAISWTFSSVTYLNHKDMKTTLNVYARTDQDAVMQARKMVQREWLRQTKQLAREETALAHALEKE
jgi:hypothetical protein